MVEGGLFAWKLQKVNQRGPAGDYRKMQLPDPPKDHHWIQDLDTHEWHLAKITTREEEEDVEVKEMEIPASGFVLHEISPEDTFQGICLRYRITPTDLRRANGGFSGTNLHLVPNPLRIPVNQKYLKSRQKLDKGPTTPAEKIQALQRSCRNLHKTEAKCYLELNDWDVEKALENAKEDGF
mmetsp:Transcript_23006/g.66019  ORF Transcript_23006/g.66019 Transcript_23006/m.66019 type:complete len:181 (+) Transcript_23006:58-600(+)